MEQSGEVITIFIGQAGAQLAMSCWELFCLEHGLLPNGCFCPGYYPQDTSIRAFFSQLNERKLTPRTIIIDLEPTVIDEIRTGPYRGFFNPQSLISGKEDASNNFAAGYYSVGREMIDLAVHRVCRTWEQCSKPTGFMVFRSLNGGTGGGFGNLLLERLTSDFPKHVTVDFAICPAPNISNIIVEPYNAVFAAHGSMDHVDCSFLTDNEALYDICKRNLDLEDATYTNLNRILAQVVSSITASMRFEGSVNVTLEELQTNLIPFPRIHYCLATYAPLISPKRAFHAEITTQQITYDCFEPSNQMMKCDPSTGAYTSCCLLYRGDVGPNDVNKAIASLKGKKSIQFVGWSPTGFKVGINYQPTTSVPGGDLASSRRTVSMLSNNTAVRQMWTALVNKFDMMYEKKAFVHHYISEGMEESLFQEARDNIETLINDYKEVEK
ncbi:tubulin alpha-2/alpha-4 chain [Nomia melanderi]|uniref:tubulin alpha-2/alpha-4 chain n=1 Tax=Nomia melanderi TaxID=2448451 RepID=UPI001304261C|nr:tubulin alpha-4 chain-like [Nomia melanderi]